MPTKIITQVNLDKTPVMAEIVTESSMGSVVLSLTFDELTSHIEALQNLRQLMFFQQLKKDKGL